MTCRASLAAYAGAKGFDSCDVMILWGAFFVFFAMALLQKKGTIAAWEIGGWLYFG